jgi:carbamate kinase
MGYGTPAARPLHQVIFDELRFLDLAAGSMGPKVDAACRFVERTGHTASIGALTDAREVLTGEAGTTIWPSTVPLHDRPGIDPISLWQDVRPFCPLPGHSYDQSDTEEER